MQLLIFILVYPLIWLLSILPMWILYFISDGLYILLYYVIGYRKKVVRYNLKLSFPEKSDEERLEIEKKSFRHFVDIFMEMIKSFTISENELSKRMIFKNPEVLNRLYPNNNGIILMTGHYANWEWASLYISRVIEFEMYGIYKELSNKYFDKALKQSRRRFGAHLVPTKKSVIQIIQNKRNHIKSLYGLISDQSPLLKSARYWSDFMGNRVPVITGGEILAKKYDYPVAYIKAEQVKRGYYIASMEIITESPKSFENFEITDIFLRKLEAQIRKDPAYYFWTHNRFKHMGKENLKG